MVTSLRARYVLCALAFAIAACGTTTSSAPPATPPVQSAESFGQTLRIRLQPTFPVEAVFAAGLLIHVKDHPPLSELRRRLGEPASTRTDQCGEVWYRFPSDDRVVEAGRVVHDSNGPQIASWYVYSVPKKSILEIVDRAVAAELKRHPEARTLIVTSAGGDEAVSCEMSKDLHGKCVWFTSSKERARGL
jgi:hypothetical protein